MDGLTAGLWVAANFASSLISGKNQAKVQEAQVKMQTEQARLQASEQAYERTKQFRQNMAQNLALSGMGFGGVSGFRGLAGQNVSDYFADMGALGRQDMFAQLAGKAGFAQNKAVNFANTVSSFESSVSLADKLRLFKKKAAK